MTFSVPRPREDPAADASRLLARLGLAVLALGLPSLSLLSRRAVFIVFPIGCGLILLAALLRPRDQGLDRLRAALLSPAGYAALFFVGWAALSVLWTPFKPEAIDHLVKAVGTALLATATAAAMQQHTRSSDLYLAPVGVAAGAALVLAMGFRPADAADADCGTLSRGIMTLSVLLWPALGALGAREHWGLGALLTAAVAAGAALIWSPALLVALGCGALVFAIARYDLPRLARRLGIAAAALCVLAPLLPLAGDALFALRGAEGSDIAHGAASWAAIVKNDPARLLTGHGLDAALRSAQANFLPADTPRGILFEVWYDLGMLGAAGLALLLFLAYRAAGRSGPGGGPALAGGLTAVLALALAGQQTTQVWWLTLLSAGAVSACLVLRGQFRTTRPPARLAPSGEAR